MSGVNHVLETLFTTGKLTLPESNTEVTIKKVTLRTMKPVTTLMAQVLEDLQLDANNLPTVDFNSPAMILKLISKYYDAIVDILGKLTDLGEDKLLDMEADESVLVVQAVVALNKDFFMNRVLPNMQLLGESEKSASMGSPAA